MRITLAFVFISFVAFTAHGQGMTGMEGQMRMAAPSGPKQGPSVALIYTNLTDYSYKYQQADGNTGEMSGSTHLGLGGARLSYLFNSPGVMAFDGGISLQTSLNKSEAAESVTLGTFDLNMILKGSSGVNIYFGPSMSKLSAAGATVEYSPAVGGQIGLGYQSGGLNLRAGYSHHGMKMTDGEASWTGHVGGFSTQLGYVF